MTLIPASHSRFGWFRSGLLGGAGRGGPLRLVGIVSVIALSVGLAIFASMHSDRFQPQSQVAKMKPGNLLPGGLQGTPAQDALLKTDSQEKAHKAEEEHKSYTPPIPSSYPFNGPPPGEVGVGASPDFRPTLTKIDTPRPPAIVPEPLRRVSPWRPNTRSTAPALSGPPTTAPRRPPPQTRRAPISNVRRRSATC